MTSSAQSGQDLVDIGVGLNCGSIRVTLNSDYDRAVKAQVYAGTRGLTLWDLVNDIGDFTTAGANGTGSKTYFFLVQPPNTSVSFSVRVYDDVTNGLVAIREGTRDCDGEANNAPPPVTNTTTTTTTTTTATTPSFLAACNASGGILVQPIGGTNFTISSMQISQGTAMAISSNSNVAITTVGNISAVGTPNNAVLLAATDGYSLTIPVTTCAQTVTVTYPTTTTTSAAAQAATVSCSNTPSDAVNTHVVRAGENLFRIGLRYGVAFQTLAVYNGIPDATRIFVGQCIAIPPA